MSEPAGAAVDDVAAGVEVDAVVEDPAAVLPKRPGFKRPLPEVAGCAVDVEALGVDDDAAEPLVEAGV